MQVLNQITTAPRRTLALIAAICVGMLAFGMYLQYVQGLEPCPMCIVQRYLLVLVCIDFGRCLGWTGKPERAKWVVENFWRTGLAGLWIWCFCGCTPKLAAMESP